MKYHLYITKSAERDLESAVDYIEFTSKNPSAADELLNLTEEKLKQLEQFPEIHQVVNDSVLSALGIRYIIINNYIAFYVIIDDIIYIIRFLYGKRNWISFLKQGYSLD